MNRFLALGATAACSISALAFATDCRSPATTADMKICASQNYAAADRELNSAWPVAVAYLKNVDAGAADAGVPASMTPAAKLLTTAQLSWISHRDLDCAASTASSNGGSIRDVFKLECLAEKTRARTAELRSIGGDGSALDMPADVQARFDEIQSSLDECKDQSSTIAWKFCVGAAHEVADRELNERYSIAKNALARYPGAVDSLVSSELAWIKVRDNDCQAITRENFGGTGHSGFAALCHIRKTIERTQELRARFPNK